MEISNSTHVESQLARIGLISKRRYYFDEACLLKMYHSLIESHVDYNILNWSCTNPFKSFMWKIAHGCCPALRAYFFQKKNNKIT